MLFKTDNLSAKNRCRNRTRKGARLS